MYHTLSAVNVFSYAALNDAANIAQKRQGVPFSAPAVVGATGYSLA
jgi:hypothetical protein